MTFDTYYLGVVSTRMLVHIDSNASQGCVNLAVCPLDGGLLLIHMGNYHTLFKGTYIFCLAHSLSEWHTYTIHVSIVQGITILL